MVLYAMADGDDVFAIVELPESSIPDVFSPQSTISFVDQEFVVVSTKPETRAEAIETGKLEIFVQESG